jgi:uncharacterized membrane protein YgcG
VPSYTDRVLLRQPLLAGVSVRTSQTPAAPPSVLLPQLRCAAYDASDDLTISDHMPVGAVWELPLSGAAAAWQAPLALPGCPPPAPPFPVTMPACFMPGNATSSAAAGHPPGAPSASKLAAEPSEAGLGGGASQPVDAAAPRASAQTPETGGSSSGGGSGSSSSSSSSNSNNNNKSSSGGRNNRVAPLLAKPALSPAALAASLAARDTAEARLASMLTQVGAGGGVAPLLEEVTE